MKVKKLKEDVKLPVRMNDSAGYDIFANEDRELEQGIVVMVGTGLIIEIPKNHVGMICDRSGLASKGITTRVARVAKEGLIKWLQESDEEFLSYHLHPVAGIIDSDYRGEVKVLLVNISPEKKTIKKGDRIAQLLILPITNDIIESVLSSEEVSKVSESFRGSSGFGSTG